MVGVQYLRQVMIGVLYLGLCSVLAHTEQGVGPATRAAANLLDVEERFPPQGGRLRPSCPPPFLPRPPASSVSSSSSAISTSPQVPSSFCTMSGGSFFPLQPRLSRFRGGFPAAFAGSRLRPLCLNKFEAFRVFLPVPVFTGPGSDLLLVFGERHDGPLRFFSSTPR